MRLSFIVALRTEILINLFAIYVNAHILVLYVTLSFCITTYMTAFCA